jgi:hypothetical protein
MIASLSYGKDVLAQQETPYGMLKPPLGSARLTVIALLAVLLRTSSALAEEAVISSHILKQVLHLVPQYPFNSILHHQVCTPAARVFHPIQALCFVLPPPYANHTILRCNEEVMLT